MSNENRTADPWVIEQEKEKRTNKVRNIFENPIGYCKYCRRTTKEVIEFGHATGCPNGVSSTRTSSVLKVYRIRPGAKLPVKAHSSDAGYDLFYCPPEEELPHFNKKEGTDEFVIYPDRTGVIPTGIKAEVPKGYMLEIKNKSGIASKRQLVVGACVVDSGYNAEVFVNLHNLGLKKQSFKPGDKIAQAVIIPVMNWEVEEASEDNLNQNSSRGEGGFGSTGDR